MPDDCVVAVFHGIGKRKNMIVNMNGITEEKRAEALYNMQIKNGFVERYSLCLIVCVVFAFEL